MKKTYSSIKLFIVLLSLVAVNMHAQMSGLYTINSASPTAGNNYQTFNAFKTALLVAGINGPVTVDVVANSGPYLEQVDFPAIVGASAANTITINGNGCSMTFQGTFAAPWTLGFSGGDYFTVNNLIVNGTDASYALVCHLWNGSDFNNFNNCTFNCPAQGTNSGQSPYCISGSATGVTTAGNSGNNNIATGCNMNWGYWGVVMYGLTGLPYNVDNQIINCTIRDFYVYGAYNAYTRRSIYRNNVIERPNRLSVTTTYGLFFTTGTYQSTVEKNKVQKLFESATSFNTSTYGIYNSASSALGLEGNFKNNVVSITKNLGTNIGMYILNSSYTNVYHNTVSIDDQAAGGTGTTYGIYAYGTNCLVKNNNISITKGGAGTRYGLYYASTMTNGSSNANNIWVSSLSGVNNIGYYIGTTANSMATWTVVNGFDANSVSTDPYFVNPAIQNYMPGSYTMNNIGLPLGLTDDVLGASRSMVTPDPGAYEYFNTPCAGTPTANTVITPTTIVCPNAQIGAYLANSYTTSGHTFQWQTSTVSPVGPFVAIPSGTNSALTATVGSSVIWYSAIVTCTNSNNNITAVSGSVNVAGTTIDNVPYYENFEGILGANKLPNCSWTGSNMGNTCLTYMTAPGNNNLTALSGTKFASFYYSPAGNNYFWTNGIQLNAGVTYSTSMWFQTEYYGYTNWNLNMWVGPNQSTVGANVVATTGGVAASAAYKSLSNTFTVATSGIYYMGINGISTGACCGYNLTWDDLRIEIPCSMNQPVMTINSNAQTVCAGQNVNITANGASSYLWNNGATTNMITVAPTVSGPYYVIGTNAASGCTAAISQNINVNPSPVVNIYAPNTSVCAGSSVLLTAYGANAYSWSNNANTNVISVSPSASTTYSVLGTNSFGCSSMATQAIVVNPIPNVGITTAATSSLVCDGDVTSLLGTGAATYQWSSNAGVVPGNPINVSPTATTIYYVTGTSAQGCSSTTSYQLEVTNCVGINSISSSNSGIKLYPNPNNGVFTIEWNTTAAKTAQVVDITGRVILTSTTSEDKMNINMSSFANGVYYVKLLSDTSSEVIKIVKQ